ADPPVRPPNPRAVVHTLFRGGHDVVASWNRVKVFHESFRFGGQSPGHVPGRGPGEPGAVAGPCAGTGRRGGFRRRGQRGTFAGVGGRSPGPRAYYRPPEPPVAWSGGRRRRGIRRRAVSPPAAPGRSDR